MPSVGHNFGSVKQHWFFKVSRYMHIWCLNVLPAFFKRKININFLNASLKTLINAKNCSESHIKFRFRVPGFNRSHWSNSSSVHSTFILPAFRTIFRITGGFRNNFKRHMWLSESRTQTARIFFKKRQSKIMKIFNAQWKLLFWFLEPSKNISPSL